jgi:multicomponent K+:H+ antiporter subunit D
LSTHAPILPILIAFAAALLQMACDRLSFQRLVGLLSAALLVMVGIWLTWLADDGQMRVYALGDWRAPFGIVLVVDRLAAAMALLTAVLGFVALLYASAGFDQRGKHFHPLFQLQLMGLLGAFLTGDLFNLFVFFEVMLLASYILLAHGGGLARTRAGISYAVLNLIGSAIFLIALGLLYGTLGTLNLADVARRLLLPGYDQALARLAFALLIAVFVLKAGLLPLSFWLPQTYTAAGVPVAALFAIMTKVGIVTILRVQVIAMAPAMPDLLDHWLTPLALAPSCSRHSARWPPFACVRSPPGWCCSRPGHCWPHWRSRAPQSLPRQFSTWCIRPWPAPLSSCWPESLPDRSRRPPG